MKIDQTRSFLSKTIKLKVLKTFMKSQNRAKQLENHILDLKKKNEFYLQFVII
jgi:hypothetical protein